MVGFVGRFTRDKGLTELMHAFHRAAEAEPKLRSLVGRRPRRDRSGCRSRLAQRLKEDARIVCTGFVDEPGPLLRADEPCLCSPATAKVFPNAPARSRRGWPADRRLSRDRHRRRRRRRRNRAPSLRVTTSAAFTRAILRYAGAPELGQAHGSAGQRRVTQLFRREVLWAALEAEYRRLAAAAGVI